MIANFRATVFSATRAQGGASGEQGEVQAAQGQQAVITASAGHMAYQTRRLHRRSLVLHEVQGEVRAAPGQQAEKRGETWANNQREAAAGNLLVKGGRSRGAEPAHVANA